MQRKTIKRKTHARSPQTSATAIYPPLYRSSVSIMCTFKSMKYYTITKFERTHVHHTTSHILIVFCVLHFAHSTTLFGA